MPTISEVRAKYPQYKDLSDDQLAEGLHRKYYSDMPIQTFRAKVGLELPKTIEDTPVKPKSEPSTFTKIGEGMVRGVKQRALGVAQLIGEATGTSSKGDLMSELAAQYEAEGEGTGIAGLAGEILGDPLTYMPLGGAAKGASALSKIGNIAKTGAAVGAISAGTSATGGEEDRLTKTLIGGAVGAPVALGGEALMRGARAVGSTVAKPMQKLAGGLGVSPEKITQMADAGLPTNLAASSNNALPKRLYNRLREGIGSSNTIEGNIADTRNAVDSALSGLGYKNVTKPENAGRVIEGALDRFNQRGQSRYKKLDDAFTRLVGEQDVINVDTLKLADRLESIINKPGIIPSQADAVASSKPVREIADLVEFAAANDGAVPYGALKEARTKLGRMINDPFNMTTQESTLAKQGYSALTDAMKDFAKARGGDKALKTFETRDRLYSDFMEEKTSLVNKMLKKANPEAMFNSLIHGTKQGGAVPVAVMKKLNPVERDMMRDAMIGKLGGGEDFNPTTYFTQYKKLSPEAKDALFLGKGELRAAHDKLAVAMDNLKSVNAFSNPSGSGMMQVLDTLFNKMGSTVTGAGLTAFGVANPDSVIGQGSLMIGGTLISSSIINKVMAEAMTSPKFVNSLSKAAQKAANNQKVPPTLARTILETLYNKGGLSHVSKVAIQQGAAQ